MKVALVTGAIVASLLSPASVAAPLPDSAVGNHKPVKVTSHTRGYWVTTEVRGRSGKWSCWIPKNYKTGTPTRCVKL